MVPKLHPLMHYWHDDMHTVITPQDAHFIDVDKAKCVEPGTERCIRHFVTVAVVQGATVMTEIVDEVIARGRCYPRQPIFGTVWILVATLLGNCIPRNQPQQS
jgi:hypothetical protein